MHFHIVTIFPDMFSSYFNESIISRAIKNKLLTINTYSLREYTKDKHRRVDGIAYGGGPGMVMWVDPIINCVNKINLDIEKRVEKEKKKHLEQITKIEDKIFKLNLKIDQSQLEMKKFERDFQNDLFRERYTKTRSSKKVFTEEVNAEYKKRVEMFNLKRLAFKEKWKEYKAELKDIENNKIKQKTKYVLFTPEQIEFTNALAKQVVEEYTDIVFICGRYEGVDYRVKEILNAEEWSIGPYVLTGGELPAMVCIDAISRQIKGVLNDNASLEENRVSSHKVYARPEVYEYVQTKINIKKKVKDGKEKLTKTKTSKKTKHIVPKVLLSGNHKLIDEWRKEN